MADEKPVRIEREGAVATLLLDRPDQRNAMSAALVAGLIAAVDALDQDPEVGAILLAGAGRGFCAGSDLAGLAAMSAAERALFEAESGRAARLLSYCRKPVVAAVAGFAIGGGLTLATSCDVVITAPDAKWSLPEVPIGLFPAWGIASVVARIGAPAARRLCWGIDTFDGKEAARIGLADGVAPDPLAAARETAGRLATLPRAQAMAVKEYFRAHAPDEAADMHANSLFQDAAASAEAAASFDRYGRS